MKDTTRLETKRRERPCSGMQHGVRELPACTCIYKQQHTSEAAQMNISRHHSNANILPSSTPSNIHWRTALAMRAASRCSPFTPRQHAGSGSRLLPACAERRLTRLATAARRAHAPHPNRLSGKRAVQRPGHGRSGRRHRRRHAAGRRLGGPEVAHSNDSGRGQTRQVRVTTRMSGLG